MEAEEADRAAQAQRAVFAELHEVFEYNDLMDHAERKYDYDEVYDQLTEILERVDESYQGAIVKRGHWVFPSEEAQEMCKKASEEYLDTIVRYKEFVHDNAMLKVALAKKIMSYVDFEQFSFDWHYWQLFRRHLHADMENQAEALAAIERDCTDSSDEESWDTSDDEE